MGGCVGVRIRSVSARRAAALVGTVVSLMLGAQWSDNGRPMDGPWCTQEVEGAQSTLTAAEAQRMIEIMDFSGDGTVSFSDFKEALTH